MRAVRVLALGAAMVVGTGGVAFAQQTDSSAQPRAEQERGGKGQPGKRGMRREGRRAGPGLGRALFRDIELSAEQRTRVRQIGEKHRAEQQQLRQRAGSARTEGQRPDSAQRAALREQRLELMQRHRAELRAVLTPEQRTTFDRNVQELEKRMSERRAVFQIGVTYDTPPEKLRAIPAIVRAAVEAQQTTRFERCHLKAFGPSSLDFETVYFMLVPDYNDFMDVQQEINLELFERMQDEGIEFAYPTQTLLVRGGTPS